MIIIMSKIDRERFLDVLLESDLPRGKKGGGTVVSYDGDGEADGVSLRAAAGETEAGGRGGGGTPRNLVV